MLPRPMRFAPYADLGTEANVIVDGAAQAGTVLTLSHWPKSGTPQVLKRDTSAEIVFAYLDAPEMHQTAELVSNNHFDEDGLVAVYALTRSRRAWAERELLIDVAGAGDFGVYRDRRAARIVFTLFALADPVRSPLPAAVFRLPAERRTAALYERLLPELPEIVDGLEGYRRFWETEDRHLERSETQLREGRIELTENAGLDLAIVRIPQHREADRSSPAASMDALCHPFAVYTASSCSRVLFIHEQTFEFRYRYESWVQMHTRRPLPRVRLEGLCERLDGQERSGGRWLSGPVEDITPCLRLSGSACSSIAPAQFLAMLEDHLAAQPPAWDPYD